MKITPQLYPKLFNQMKLFIKKEIKKNKITVNTKKFKSNVGRAYPDESYIKIPEIKDIESVYIIFHEIGHIKLNHSQKSFKRLYIKELEAEKYALSIMRKFQIHKIFPKEYKRLYNMAINYVVQNIYYEIEKGLTIKELIPSVLYFCRLNKKK